MHDKIIVSASGGIDSMVLIQLLSGAGYSFAIGHCNFQLRAKESDEDEQFVAAAAKQYDKKIFIQKFDTGAYADECGISIQMAARALRRAWFETLCEQHGFNKICTAHHLNDAIETVIFNLTKGTGIAGLQGILPQSGRFVRPLLFATREMITQFADNQNIAWREDHSNASTKYARNKIRHLVIPELKKINPNLETTFRTTSEKIIAANNIFREAIEGKKESLMSRQGDSVAIDIKKLLDSAHPAVMLYEIIKDFGFNFIQAKQIIEGLQNQPGRVFNSESHQLTQDRECLLLDTVNATPPNMAHVNSGITSASFSGVRFIFEQYDMSEFSLDMRNEVACLDLELIKFPLLIRYWEKGDYFFPLGMQAKKKVSDFMIDKKIPVNLKSKTITIFSGNDMVWLVGHRIDHRFRLTDKTRKVLKITKALKHD